MNGAAPARRPDPVSEGSRWWPGPVVCTLLGVALCGLTAWLDAGIFLWWVGVAVVVFGLVALVAVAPRALGRPLPLTVRVVAVLLISGAVVFAGFRVLHPEPLRTPGWSAGLPSPCKGAQHGPVVAFSGVEAFAADDGTVAWHHDAEGNCVVADGVVVARAHGTTWRGYDLRTGDQLWERAVADTGADLMVESEAVPAIHDGLVVIGRAHDADDGKVATPRGAVALDLRTGEVRWTLDRGRLESAKAAPADAAGIDVPALVQAYPYRPGPARMKVIDVTTGEVLRSLHWSDFSVTAYGVVARVSDHGRLRGFPLDPNAPTWQVEWPVAPPSPGGKQATYADRDRVRVLDLRTGKLREEHIPGGWQARAGDDRHGWVHVGKGRDRHALWHIGEDHVVELTGFRSREQSLAWSSSGSRAAVRLDVSDAVGHGYERLDLTDGSRVWHYRLDHGGTPHFVGGLVLVDSSPARLVPFPAG